MNITFFGYDYTLDIMQRLVADGHRIMQIFTFPCDQMFSFNEQIHAFAAAHNITITEDAVERHALTSLIDRGCEVFLSAGYPYKIPTDVFAADAPPYALNLHPTYLPKARGVMPLPYVIMHEPDAAGVSLHKLSSEFDTGDIIIQYALNISDTTDIETLSARIAVRCPDIVSQTIADLPSLWDKATPQDHESASQYPLPNARIRTLDWSAPVDQIALTLRAFGRFGTIAEIHNDQGLGQKIAVFNASTWYDEHPFTAGTLIRSSPREIIVALSDGFICIKEFQVMDAA